MRTRSMLGAGMGAAWLLLTAAGSARAEGTACGTETDIVADGRIFQSTIPNGSTFWFGTFLSVGRSYVLEVRYTKAGFGTVPLVNSFEATRFACTTPLSISRDITLIDAQERGTARKISFITTSTQGSNLGGDGAFHSFSLQNTTGVSQDYSISLSETTMFSPAWTTNGTFNTYWSFENTTSSDLCTPNGCPFTLFDTFGNVVFATNILVLPAKSIAGFNTSDLAVPRNKVGNVRFTHDGPPGAILVKANQANFALSPPFIELVPFQAVRQTQ